MINHLRTLLRNRDGRGWSATVPGEEYAPPEFRALALPAPLKNVHAVLFGARPDLAFLNYRLRQYLTIVHASPLAEFVTALDPRITYLGADNIFIAPNIYTPQVLALPGTLPALRTFGAPLAPDVTGRMQHIFRVDAVDSGTIQVARQSSPAQKVLFNPTFAGGLSSPMELPGAGYKFRVEVVAGGEAWLVSFYNRPQWDLGQIAANLDSLSFEAQTALFGTDAAEPYKSWRNLWNQHQELPTRLGAVVLALGYRMEELRTNNGE